MATAGKTQEAKRALSTHTACSLQQLTFLTTELDQDCAYWSSMRAAEGEDRAQCTAQPTPAWPARSTAERWPCSDSSGAQ